MTYNNARSYQMSWQGRRLTSVTVDGKTYVMEYNDEGVRQSKTVNGVKTSYYYDGTMLIAEETEGAYTVYVYDAQGSPIGFQYRESSYAAGVWDVYWYEKNLQGDIISIYDNEGTKLVTYTYNAWGDTRTGYINGGNTTTVKKNNLTYRGYYYDADLHLYYLISRYYDCTTGRFINADSAISGVGGDMLGCNMYAYCFNNPVNLSDPTGNWPELSTIFAVAAVTAFVVAAVAVTVATYGTAAPLIAGGVGIIGGMSAGAVATAASVATSAIMVARVSAAAAVASAVVEKIVKRDNSVYVLKDDTGTVQYVGRTNNVDKRRLSHSANPFRAGLEMEVIASGLNLQEARALEQAGMVYYHTINTANKMNNQINSVSPKYWGVFKELALGVLRYGWNQMSNEILYWTGN